MSKFKVGDKVKLIEVPELRSFSWYKNNSGKVMTVKKAYGSSNEVVENPFGFSDVWLEPAANSYELHITCNDGKTTNAVYKLNGKIEKRTEAVCAPSDTFDFATGAQTAFDRVFPKVQPAQPIAPQEDKGKYKSGDKVKVLANTNAHCFEIGKIVTLCGERLYNGAVEKFYWSTGVDSGYVREQDVEPYAEPEQPKSKYESMSDSALKSNACFRSTLCSTSGERRKSNCPFYGKGGCSTTIVARKDLIAYLESEDAPSQEPKATEPKLTLTREMLEKLGACSSGISTFDRLFSSGNGELKDVCLSAKKDGHANYSEWLTNRKDRIGKMQNQSKESVELYCVKDCENANRLTKGKLYEFNGLGVTYDDGWCSSYPKSFESWKSGNRIYADCLVPLVKRPAKVGEWVLVTHTDFAYCCPSNKVYCVESSSGALIRIGGGWNFGDDEYLVLDNYRPEPEKEPEPVYYSGKVVCTENENTEGFWTIGKVYEFKNGYAMTDCGEKSPVYGAPINALSEYAGVKFIPYLGE